MLEPEGGLVVVVVKALVLDMVESHSMATAEEEKFMMGYAIWYDVTRFC